MIWDFGWIFSFLLESQGDSPIDGTVNKGLAISCPRPGRHLPNSPWPRIIYTIPVPGRFGPKKIHESPNFFSQGTVGAVYKAVPMFRYKPVAELFPANV